MPKNPHIKAPKPRTKASTSVANPKRQVSEVPLTISRPEMLVDGSDRQFRRLVHALFAFFPLHEAIRDSYASYIGLGGIQYSILLCIRNLSAAGTVNVRDVAKYLRISGSFITVETGKLQKLGLLEKKRVGADRRRVALTVTPKGAALLNTLAPIQRQVNDVQFACLSAKQFHELLKIVEDLIECSEHALTLLTYLKGGHPEYKSMPAKRKAGNGADSDGLEGGFG